MRAYQVGARLSGNLDAVDCSNGMIELLARLLEAAFDWASAGWYLSMRGKDELHLLRHEREEVVSSAMFELAPCKRHAAGRGQARRDLARVYTLAALHNCRAEENGRLAVRVHERCLARLVETWEGLARRAQGHPVPRRRYLALWRRPSWGHVSWGRVVGIRNGK